MLLSFSAAPSSRTAFLPARRTSPAVALRYARKTTSAMLSVHVNVKVTPGKEEEFKKASIENARNSVQEPGVARFDVLQDIEDPTRFKLVEVYDGADAPAAHKETKHYAVWRDTVADWMAEPRSANKYTTVAPASRPEWNVPKALASGAGEADGEAESFFVLHPTIWAKPEHAQKLRDLLVQDSKDSLAKEPGVLRFDLAVAEGDPAEFTLNEVYTNEAAFESHCKEPWFLAVMGNQDLFGKELVVRKFRNVYPKTKKGWKSEA